MQIPYVIDNEKHRLSDVLNDVLGAHEGQSLDVATAYFTIGGFKLIKEGLEKLGSFRLLIGEKPRSGESVGLRPDAKALLAAMRADLEAEPFTEETLRLVEDLIRFLRREEVSVRTPNTGFLHAKCYLFYSDKPGQQFLFERFRPVLAIVGSSNFTAPGMTSNRELNLTHKVILDEEEANDPEAQQAISWLSNEKPSEKITPLNRKLIKSEVGARAIIELESWFERQWDGARDFKEELIALLDASKFGRKEYTPYEVYMKALYEYFKDDMESGAELPIRSAVELTEFQKDAEKKAQKILQKYDGVLVADPVGVGKTWIGKKLLEEYAYRRRQKALVICPASLRPMWDKELKEATISATILSQEEMGREEFSPERYGDADVILVDESHNFRNRNAQRYGSIENIISLNGGRGRDGLKKKIILLTATPINNDLFDLYQQINLFTGGDRSYFAGAGIGDLYRYFLKARREARVEGSTIMLFNLLEEVTVRRTRPFIRKAYPEATMKGKKIRFPERKLKTVNYNLEDTYHGIYDEIVSGIENLILAPYNLENYKKEKKDINEWEKGRQDALVGIFKSRYLKRLESSIEAFRISVRRAHEFQESFMAYVLDGKLLKSSDFQKALRYLAREDEEDDAVPASRADEMDASEDVQRALAELETIETKLYDLRRIHKDVESDIESLKHVWEKVNGIGPEKDLKLSRLKEMLGGELRGKKVLVFSYYKDTTRYLYKEIGSDKGVEFRESAGNPKIRRMDSGNPAKGRGEIIAAFAPVSNDRPELKGTEKEIDVLISTDVLSEGQNLQDCGHLINYDLHWNPVRMVQRAGRIDRLGSLFAHDTITIFNVFPDEGLERLLKLVESLSEKISVIDQAGFLDASILGETVHPRNFNTLRRIREEDGTVIEEQEQFTELASSEFLRKQVMDLLELGGREMLDSLQDGIHSGLIKENARGMFFYFMAELGKDKHHFWKYYDLREKQIIDNRYIIGNLISCSKDTPRVIGDYDLFGIQEKIIEDILQSHEKQIGLEAAPKTIDPFQQTVAITVQNFLNHPNVERARAVEALRYLNSPMLNVRVKELKKIFGEFQKTQDVAALMEPIYAMIEKYGIQTNGAQAQTAKRITREDLRLICFDYLCS